jgi:hypothetical protein
MKYRLVAPGTKIRVKFSQCRDVGALVGSEISVCACLPDELHFVERERVRLDA